MSSSARAGEEEVACRLDCFYRRTARNINTQNHKQPQYWLLTGDIRPVLVFISTIPDKLIMAAEGLGSNHAAQGSLLVLLHLIWSLPLQHSLAPKRKHSLQGSGNAQSLSHGFYYPGGRVIDWCNAMTYTITKLDLQPRHSTSIRRFCVRSTAVMRLC